MLVLETKIAKKQASASRPLVDSQEPPPHFPTMKMTFILPDGLARQLQSTYPREKQSQVVTGLLAKKLRAGESQLAKACRGANRLKQLALDVEDWEKLNLHDR
jgi:hypothetical protein